jgi:hypothetical protein
MLNRIRRNTTGRGLQTQKDTDIGAAVFRQWHGPQRAAVILWGLILLVACAGEPPQPSHTRNPASATAEAPKSSPAADATKRSFTSQGGADHTAATFEEESIDEPGEPEPLPSDEPPSPPQGYSFSEVITEARGHLLIVQRRLLDQSAQLAAVSEINRSYCQRWLEQKQTCNALINLQGNGTPAGETCESTLPELSNGARLQMSLSWTNSSETAPALTFYLRANDSLRTNEVTLGASQVLEWTPMPGSSATSESLNLYEISKLELVANGSLPNDRQSITFELLADGIPVLGNSDILPWEPGDTRVRLNTIPLFQLIQNPNCVVTEDDLAQIAEDVRERVSTGSDAGGEEEPLPEADPRADEEGEPEDFIAQLDTIRMRINDAENELSTRQKQMDREYDRNGKLRRLLLTEYRSGCKANEKIEKLEIFLTGSHLPDSDWDRTFTKEKKETEGRPEQLSFSFGREIHLTHSDEVNDPKFTSSGYLTSSDFSSFTVLDLQYLRIKKGGRGYSADLNCWTIIGWSKWGLGKKCEWQNRETHRYSLQDVRVKVNGQSFLRFSNLSFNFSGTEDTWQESNLAVSSEYIDFMTSPTCTHDGG